MKKTILILIMGIIAFSGFSQATVNPETFTTITDSATASGKYVYTNTGGEAKIPIDSIVDWFGGSESSGSNWSITEKYRPLTTGLPFEYIYDGSRILNDSLDVGFGSQRFTGIHRVTNGSNNAISFYDLGEGQYPLIFSSKVDSFSSILLKYDLISFAVDDGNTQTSIEQQAASVNISAVDAFVNIDDDVVNIGCPNGSISMTSAEGVAFPEFTSATRPSNQVNITIYCTDCVANDASTGVLQTNNGSTWKNHW